MTWHVVEPSTRRPRRKHDCDELPAPTTYGQIIECDVCHKRAITTAFFTAAGDTWLEWINDK